MSEQREGLTRGPVGSDDRERALRTAGDPLIELIRLSLGVPPSTWYDVITMIGRCWDDAAKNDKEP